MEAANRKRKIVLRGDDSPRPAGQSPSGPHPPLRGRRLRDRLVEREGTRNPRLRRYELANLLLFVDDDLRETALAIGGIEGFLTAALALLEKEDLDADELSSLAGDEEVLERLDYLGETVASLRRRMGLIANSLK